MIPLTSAITHGSAALVGDGRGTDNIPSPSDPDKRQETEHSAANRASTATGRFLGSCKSTSTAQKTFFHRTFLLKSLQFKQQFIVLEHDCYLRGKSGLRRPKASVHLCKNKARRTETIAGEKQSPVQVHMSPSPSAAPRTQPKPVPSPTPVVSHATSPEAEIPRLLPTAPAPAIRSEETQSANTRHRKSYGHSDCRSILG